MNGLVDDTIAKFREWGGKFSTAYQQLLDDYPRASAAGMLNQWNSLKNQADAIRNTIDYINNMVDKGIALGEQVIGLSGVRMSKRQMLGQLPLIPIAYVTAAIAALAYIVEKIIEFHTLLNASPQQIQNIQAGGASTSITGNLQNIGTLILIGIGVWLLMPLLKGNK